MIERGLIVQEETREAKGGRLTKVLTLTGPGQGILEVISTERERRGSPSPPPDKAQRAGGAYEWKATIEGRISRSLESVDVGLKRDDVRVAIEISSTSKAEAGSSKHQKMP